LASGNGGLPENRLYSHQNDQWHAAARQRAVARTRVFRGPRSVERSYNGQIMSGCLDALAIFLPRFFCPVAAVAIQAHLLTSKGVTLI
jgi:hypothetical protein